MTTDVLASLTIIPCEVEGVRHVRLPSSRDDRGRLTVLSKPGWHGSVNPQWNLASSEANVLRGLHVHLEHSDWFCVAAGTMFVGLVDLRFGSARRRSVNLQLGSDGGVPEALFIPPGVAHGFYNSEPAVHVYGTSTAWSADDELGCRFDDPDVGIDWPLSPGVTPLLSERDRLACSLNDLVAKLNF